MSPQKQNRLSRLFKWNKGAPNDSLAAVETTKKNTTQHLEPYKHHDLDDAKQQIRLLVLLTGEKDADVHVLLRKIPFVAEQSVTHEYEALSYAWGSDCGTKTVVVGEKDQSVLQVKKNLYDALLQLRLPKTNRVLWIDAICINQINDAEKSSQVALMGRIYKNATSVIAWIGAADETSNLAMTTLGTVRLSARFDVRTGKLIAKDPKDPHDWAIHKVPVPFTEAQIIALGLLLQRTYFDRVWVWQENTFGGKKGMLMCGQRTISWPDFIEVITVLFHKTIRGRTEVDVIFRSLRILSHLFNLENASFLNALEYIRACQCSDARDRIYGILGLTASDLRDVHITPNYSKTTAQVYLDAMITESNIKDNLEFLRHTGGPRVTPDLPSFIPDWATKADTREPMVRSYSSAGAQNKGILLADNRYLVQGITVCHKITHVVNTYRTENFTLMDVQFVTLQVLLEGVREQILGDLTEEHVVVLADLLCTNVHEQLYPRATLESVQHLIRKAAGLAFDENMVGVPEHGLIFVAIYGRAICADEHGTLGLVPRDAKAGDIIAVIYGATTAMCLRPTDADPGEYTVIGPASFHGTMNGEAFLGPLPHNYTMLSTVREAEVRVPGFYNRETDEVELEDPRLDELPNGWEMIQETSITEEGKYYAACFRHTESGEERWHWYQDPTLDVESLQSRGVIFEDFVLV